MKRKLKSPPPGSMPVPATMTITLYARTRYQTRLLQRAIRMIEGADQVLIMDDAAFIVVSIQGADDGGMTIGLVEYQPMQG